MSTSMLVNGLIKDLNSINEEKIQDPSKIKERVNEVFEEFRAYIVNSYEEDYGSRLIAEGIEQKDAILESLLGHKTCLLISFNF